MFQRALFYFLTEIHSYHTARIVCRATISSLKEKIDLLSDRVEKCESDRENIRYSEPGVFAYIPEYRSLEEMRENYFRKRCSAQEEYSEMIRVMDRIRQKQKNIGENPAVS